MKKNSPANPSHPMRLIAALACAAALSAGLIGCLHDADDGDAPGPAVFRNTLYVGHNGGSLVSYDIATGQAIPGEIPKLGGPTDMQTLKDGTVLVNLTDSNQILILDGKTMIQKYRIPSSGGTALKPVHSYITPEVNGKQYWVTLNDGDGKTAASNSARFILATPGSDGYLKPAGEVTLGLSHHKAAWSGSKARVTISNIGDLENIMSVYDYSDIGNIKTLATLDWKDAGLDSGKSASPHGCATSKVSGKAYCNMTGPGTVVAVDMEAASPTFKLIKTKGNGGGYTGVHPGGKYIYSLQAAPREGDTVRVGAACQIGQIAVIDASTDSLVKELPLLYKGKDCTDSITKGDEKASSASHILFSHDGSRAFVVVGGGAGQSRMEAVIDASQPGNPVQLASIAIGASGSRAQTLDGEGKLLFVLNGTDGTVSVIDPVALKVKSTLKVNAAPKALATFGEAEGPGYQAGPIH